jgi:hypothetical protein
LNWSGPVGGGGFNRVRQFRDLQPLTAKAANNRRRPCRTQSAQAAGQPAPRKHFRIEKLEERIAPAKVGGTND